MLSSFTATTLSVQKHKPIQSNRLISSVNDHPWILCTMNMSNSGLVSKCSELERNHEVLHTLCSVSFSCLHFILQWGAAGRVPVRVSQRWLFPKSCGARSALCDFLPLFNTKTGQANAGRVWADWKAKVRRRRIDWDGIWSKVNLPSCLTLAGLWFYCYWGSGVCHWTRSEPVVATYILWNWTHIDLNQSFSHFKQTHWFVFFKCDRQTHWCPLLLFTSDDNGKR